MSLCPESPIWLEWKGQTEAAWRSKGQLQGQHPPALPQVTNLGATHFSDVEKQETTTFDEEEEGATVPLRGSSAEEVFSSSEAGSSQLVRPPWPALTAVHTHTVKLPVMTDDYSCMLCSRCVNASSTTAASAVHLVGLFFVVLCKACNWQAQSAKLTLRQC